MVIAAAASALAVVLFPPGAHGSMSPTCDPARPHASGTTVKTLVTVDGERSYRLHVPAGYTGTSAVPLVLNFHGLGSTALAQEAYSEFSTKADTEGFIVAYPQGLPLGGPTNYHFNAWQLPPSEPDDVGFASQILTALGGQLCVDMNRLYSTGMSNGGMMSVRLACSMADRIAAVAPVTGAYYPPMALDLNPAETCPMSTPVPFIAFHGTADTVVPYNGGAGAVTYRLPIDDATPADDVMQSWAAHNGCTSGRQESQVDTEVRLIEYSGCSAGADVQLYAVDGGGHTWPGAVDIPSLGYTTHQISATDLIWAFFEAHPLGDPKAAVGGLAAAPAVVAPADSSIGYAGFAGALVAAGGIVFGGLARLARRP
jgi:polyhydroxybutyrate depolymerase